MVHSYLRRPGPSPGRRRLARMHTVDGEGCRPRVEAAQLTIAEQARRGAATACRWGRWRRRTACHRLCRCRRPARTWRWCSGDAPDRGSESGTRKPVLESVDMLRTISVAGRVRRDPEPESQGARSALSRPALTEIGGARAGSGTMLRLATRWRARYVRTWSATSASSLMEASRRAELGPPAVTHKLPAPATRGATCGGTWAVWGDAGGGAGWWRRRRWTPNRKVSGSCYLFPYPCLLAACSVPAPPSARGRGVGGRIVARLHFLSQRRRRVCVARAPVPRAIGPPHSPPTPGATGVLQRAAR